MKLFKDVETGEYITESDLIEEFRKKILETPQEYEHITFEQYVNNCLTRNNGTLEEVGMENCRMHECIFDITTVVYGKGGLRWQDWWPQDLDSREVFRQVCECAKWYEEYFPDDDSGDYLFDIEMLARAWFKDEYGESLTQEEKTYLFKDQRIGAQIRLHLDEGWDGYDYDNWCNVEYVVGEPINDKEYHALNGIFDSLAELDVGDRAEVKAKLEEIRLNQEKCPLCGKRGAIDIETEEESVEMKEYEVPKTDWNDAFEKLREIADKADQLAGDIEETWEYHDKWSEEHDLAIVTVRELTTIMQKAAQMADEIALTMERKELEKKRVG